MKFLGVSLKMYFDHQQTVEWAQRVIDSVREFNRPDLVEVVLIPSFGSIPALVELAKGTPVKIGAQNMADHEVGPYTGEVSAISLGQLGCTYVEVGHAERRLLYGETDQVVAAKLGIGLRAGLTPLLCVGEPEEGDPEEAGDYCVNQLERSFEETGDLGADGSLVVAYEPIWAIGTRNPADKNHVGVVCERIRQWLGSCPISSTRVVYGGSAGPGVFTALGDRVDGLFAGRYAHDPASFDQMLAEVTGSG